MERIVQCNPLSRQVSEVTLDSKFDSSSNFPFDNSSIFGESYNRSFTESCASSNASISSFKPINRVWNFSRSFAIRKSLISGNNNNNNKDDIKNETMERKSDPMPRKPIRFLSKRQLVSTDFPKQPVRYKSVRNMDTIN
jgi:hypothetical protein